MDLNGNVFDSETTAWDVLIPVPLTDNVTVGAILGTAESDFSLPTTATKIDTDTDFAGWFGIFTPTDNTRISVTNIYAWNDVDFTAAGSTGTRQSRAESWKADISYRFDQGHFYIVPTIGGFYANGEMNGFFDTFFDEFTPGVDVTVKRFYADLAVLVPLGLGRSHCTGAKGEICDEGGGSFMAHVTVVRDDIDGLVFDPTAGFGLPDTNYTGVIAGVGAMIPVHEYVSVGGTADWFQFGDMDGYYVKALVNVDIFGLFGGERRPLLEH